MRKAVAIALLFCFAIFHFGYYAFYFSANISIENRWNDEIYADEVIFSQERLLEIPLNAPYMANQEEFQTINTKFEKDGKFFRAIKQRYQNDTLQVVYVPDTARTALDSTVKKWISTLTDNDLPQDQQGKNFVKLFAKDYIESSLTKLTIPVRQGYNILIGFIFSPYMSPYFNLDSPPPQVN